MNALKADKDGMKEDHKKKGRIESCLTLVLMVMQVLAILSDEVIPFARSYFDQDAVNLSVEKTVETGIGVEYIKYFIKTEPPKHASRLGVQPYLELEYQGDYVGTILIRGLYDDAYEEEPVGEERAFVLMSKQNQLEELTDMVLNDVFEYEKGEPSLSASGFAILCVTYNEQSEKQRHNRYYLMKLDANNVEWNYLPRKEALRKINPNQTTKIMGEVNLKEMDYQEKDTWDVTIKNIVQAMEIVKKGG